MTQLTSLNRGGDIAEAFEALVSVAVAAGAVNVAALPGCFEHQVDETWWMAANGGVLPRLASNGMQVPGRAIYVERNGWPAGIIEMGGGWMAMGTEDELIAACRAAEARLKAQPQVEGTA